jgi:NTP pyrophosphatase (non-canonical NTP hydrolase)
MVSEVGELGDALIKKDVIEVIDAIGDVQVCLIILCEQLGLDMNECLESAYNVIKNRTGQTINGTFIKN